jgi:hypothetical protein
MAYLKDFICSAVVLNLFEKVLDVYDHKIPSLKKTTMFMHKDYWLTHAFVH